MTNVSARERQFKIISLCITDAELRDLDGGEVVFSQGRASCILDAIPLHYSSQGIEVDSRH